MTEIVKWIQLLQFIIKAIVNALVRFNFQVIITSTYTEGSPPESAKWFFNWVQEAAQDFR